MKYGLVLAVVFVWLSLVASVLAQDANKETVEHKLDWLRGSGKKLEIKIRGELVDRNGKTIDGCNVLCMQTHERQLDVVVQGNSFESWVPVNAVKWFALSLSATDASGELDCYKTIAHDELRDAAVNGIRLVLQPPDRFVEFHLVDDKKPVADTAVFTTIGRVSRLTKSNDQGIARVPAKNGDRLGHVGAYSDKGLVGGFTCSRRPERDPSLDKYTIEMHASREVIINTVDVDLGDAVPGIDVELHIATPLPYANFIGTYPKLSYIRTDELGEFRFRWMPDWEEHYLDIRVKNDKYVLAGDPYFAENVLVIPIVPSLVDQRKTVTGRVTGDGANIAGVCMEFVTFQAEEEDKVERHSIFSDAEGRFEFDALPDCTYYVAVCDPRLVCQPFDLVPYQSKEKKTNSPTVPVFAGYPVKIAVVDSDNVPVVNQPVHVRSNHRFSYVDSETGEEHKASSGRQWYVYTNEHGIAKAYASAGKITTSIFSHPWKDMRQEAIVSNKGVTEIKMVVEEKE